MAYFWRPSTSAILTDEPDLTGLTESQKTALIGAWSMFSENLYYHSMNIFGRFYEENMEYLRDWYTLGNDAMHQHSEAVLQFFDSLIVKGLRQSGYFDHILYNFVKSHKNFSKKYINTLNQIIKDYFLEKLIKHKTKTLEEAIDNLMIRIESEYKDFDEEWEEIKVKENFKFYLVNIIEKN